MKLSKSIYAVDTHTMGEPTRVIVGGIPKVEGSTMMEKKEYFREHYDELRRGVLMEPRGHREMVGAVIVPPCASEADFGVFFIDAGGYIDMCGHGSIGVITAAVETGIVEAREPVTHVVAECPVGLIHADVEVENGKAKSVTIVNVDAFVYRSDVEAEVPGLGHVKFDIAYGGNFAILVHQSYFCADICPENLPVLIEKATILNDWVNENMEVQHPLFPEVHGAAMVEVWGPAKSPDADYQNVVIFDGSVDRSPCGVGTSCKMAILVSRGELAIGDTFTYESVICTKFKGVPLRKSKVGDYDAIVPQISASAYITGFNHLVFDDEDPVKYGFRI